MNIDKQIEFDKVKELWANLAVRGDAKEKISTCGYLCCIW